MENAIIIILSLLNLTYFYSVPKPQAVKGKPSSAAVGKFLDIGATARNKVNNATKNESSAESRFGMRPSNEKLNTLQVVLHGTMKTNDDLANRYYCLPSKYVSE